MIAQGVSGDPVRVVLADDSVLLREGVDQAADHRDPPGTAEQVLL